jgi:hypothetical protein
LHVLVIGETPGTHVAELAGHRIGRTGKADDEDAGYEILFDFGRSFLFGRPPVTQLDIETSLRKLQPAPAPGLARLAPATAGAPRESVTRKSSSSTSSSF